MWWLKIQVLESDLVVATLYKSHLTSLRLSASYYGEEDDFYLISLAKII